MSRPVLQMEVLLRSDRGQTPDTEDLNSIPSDLEIEEDNIPDGPTFPLNSKRLKAARIRQLAAALDVPTGAAAHEVCQRLGEKIRTLGHDPANVQVIVKGKGNNSSLYLVDDTGVIKCVKENVEDHVGNQGIPNERSRSALREVEAVIESLTNELTTARQELEEANSLVSRLRAEVASLGDSNTELSRQLDKERQKSKCFWKQKCDLMLAHEDVLEERDATIAALRTQIPPAVDTEVTREPSARQLAQMSEATAPGTYRPIDVYPIPSPSPSLRMTEPGQNFNIGQVRRGKAPPVDPFTGESEEVLWEDWLPTLERAAPGMAGVKKKNCYSLRAI